MRSVSLQRGAHVEVVDKEHVEALYAPAHDLRQIVLGDLLVDRDDDLLRLRIDDVGRRDLPDDILFLYRDLDDIRLLHLLDDGLGDLLVLLHQHLVRLGVDDVGRGLLAEKQLEGRFLEDLSILYGNRFLLVEVVEDLLFRITERPEEEGDGDLLALVYANIEEFFVVELEIEPGAPVGDNPCRVGEIAAEGRF